tara:strand:- start:492 stop:1172 length:681 start_codon:yes stop_codon:yes gene_type:complete
MIDYITIRNFYDYPYDVRNWALEQEYQNMFDAKDEFGEISNFPGMRTHKGNGNAGPDVRHKIQVALEPTHGKITSWDNPWNGLFQWCNYSHRSWIHTDIPGTWAGVLFLTPNPPPGSGTGFYMHKETGIKRRIPDVMSPDSNDFADGIENMDAINAKLMLDGSCFEKWELIEEVSNEFNKLILYRGDYWHKSLEYFGTDIWDSRLFQTFFFTTEDTSLQNYKVYGK